MSAGYPYNKASLDNQMGLLVVTLRSALQGCRDFKVQKLDTATFNTAALTALGYSGADDTLIRAAFTDLTKLYDVSHAAATQSPASDFFFNANGLTGTVTG